MTHRIKATDKAYLLRIITMHRGLHGDGCDLNHIDVSGVTDMSELFAHGEFNGDISSWDVSNVRNMSRMFLYSRFDGDISRWNTRTLENMSFMFCASVFNDDISLWNTSNVKTMTRLFNDSEFNGDLSRWNISSVLHMDHLFKNSKFTGDISEWVLSEKVTNSQIFNRFHDSPLGFLGMLNGDYPFPEDDPRLKQVHTLKQLCEQFNLEKIAAAKYIYAQLHTGCPEIEIKFNNFEIQ